MKKTAMTKKEIAFEERMSKQRARRGFLDRDAWSIDFWFYETISPMLKQLAKTAHGFQTLDEKGNLIYKDKLSKKETDLYMKRWTDTILHMAFLADEMNEETCSMKNPYEKEWSRIHRIFEKKYGFFGEKLQTAEDKKEAKETGFHRAYFPEDDPDHGKEYKKVTDQYLAFDRKIDRYRNKCKNEFFRLFSKYYWCLWD